METHKQRGGVFLKIHKLKGLITVREFSSSMTHGAPMILFAVYFYHASIL